MHVHNQFYIVCNFLIVIYLFVGHVSDAVVGTDSFKVGLDI